MSVPVPAVVVRWHGHDVEQGHDMGVAAELGQGTRLAQQPRHRRLVVALGPLRFQRDVLAHHRVVGQPHLAPSSLADDLFEDTTATEPLPGTHTATLRGRVRVERPAYGGP
ncbi:hypothetical protein [Streptomyces acidiscabies]|uniref:hypothetical protein n=1 Tax=Streptomyces acidiscabies TaxID=42234 RepID=UPI0038F63EFC